MSNEGGRESFHKSEKTKWEAKSAKLDYQEKIRQVEAALDRENASDVKAESPVFTMA
jgi:hypothetical protein